MLSTPRLLQQAQQQHQAGQWPEAQALYEQILQCEAHPMAYYGLGVLYKQRGQLEAAERLLRQAVAARANFPEALHDLGNTLQSQGKSNDALECYGQVLTLRPSNAEAWLDLSVALLHVARYDEAGWAAQQALALRPNWSDAILQLGGSLQSLERFTDAILCYRRILELTPDHLDAQLNLSITLTSVGEIADAAQMARRVLALGSPYANDYTILGRVLALAGDFKAAVSCFREAISREPGIAQTHEALGSALFCLGQFEEAERAARQSIHLQPEAPDGHVLLGFLSLIQGDYKAGWPEYDRIADTDPKTRYHFAQPRWDGTVQKEATLLLYAQHGFGDTLWFARYLSLVRERVGRLILACPPELVRLMEQCPALDAVLTQDRKAGVIYDLPPFDTHINLMSLPVVFGTCPNTIPIEMPWLYVPQESSERWRSFFAPFTGRKIGIVWAGSDNGFRSCSLADFSPLARVPDVTFFSLQKGPMASALATAPLNGCVIDLAPQLFDFAETAAALMHLDLLISIDTAVVHLAGALGKPVWTLMTSSPGWVWGREGSDSLWYPTMRLFRQSPAQDWKDVLQEVADALRCAGTIS